MLSNKCSLEKQKPHTLHNGAMLQFVSPALPFPVIPVQYNFNSNSQTAKQAFFFFLHFAHPFSQHLIPKKQDKAEQILWTVLRKYKQEYKELQKDMTDILLAFHLKNNKVNECEIDYKR